MSELIVGAVQLALGDDLDANLDKIERHVRKATSRGATLVVLQELIDGCYFCKDIDLAQRRRARPAEGHQAITRLSALARELGVVLPVSFYEQAGKNSFNSLAMIDADGSLLGIYRKSHIPDAPGYSEKSYFHDGDTRAAGTRLLAHPLCQHQCLLVQQGAIHHRERLCRLRGGEASRARSIGLRQIKTSCKGINQRAFYADIDAAA